MSDEDREQESQHTFFVARIDGPSGKAEQQVSEGQQRLEDAGLTGAQIVDSLGSHGLFLLRTENAISTDELNRDLSQIQGYKYLQGAEGNAETGRMTRIIKGDLKVNPLAFLTQTGADVSPYAPGPGGGTPLAPPTILGSFAGLDANVNPFLLSPPDPIVAVGPDHVVEAVNVAMRIYSKDGTVLQTQLLDDFFAPLGPTAGDPLVTYDEGAGRWYVAAIDGININNILLAVSNTSNPLDGFTEMQRVAITSPGDLADFPKMGFNADAVVIEVNDFGSGGGAPRLTAIDKATLLDADPSTYTAYNSTPATNFRAMVPATMHGAAPGSDVMYFVQERSYGDGDFVQVVQMTSVLSDSPVFNYHDIDVNDYGFPPAAQQPGGFINTNDTTFLNADWRNGRLVAAHSVGDFSDGDAHAAWYLFEAPDSAAATPTLIQEGRLDPGDGISTYYPTMAITAGGAIGMTYMQSSPSQYASMYVTGRSPGDAPGTMSEGALVAEGEDFLDGFFRAGDYSGIVVDPVDGATFWAANEYKAADAFWSTAIAHFSLGMTVTTTSPANGAIVSTRPTEYVVDFSDPFDTSLINPAGVLVNGNPSTGYTIVDDNTISFTFTTDPVSGQGAQQFDVEAGTVVRLSDGDPLQAYTSTFRYDVLRMEVVSTVPADGSVATLPLNKITVNLNEPYAASSVGTDDLTLSIGTVAGFTLVDADTIDYLVSGVTQEGTLKFSLRAGALADAYGNPSLPYSAAVTLDYGTVPFPSLTTPINPQGGLIYETSAEGTILPAGDTDSFTLSIDVDRGQTITVIVEPKDKTLRPKVTLTNLDGNAQGNVGSVTAPGPGMDAVIQTNPVPGSLTNPAVPKKYKVTVAGANGTTGGYTVRLILNAAAELENYDGATNDTRGTAQSLEDSFVTLNNATPKAERGAAVGRVRGGVLPGEAYVGVRSFNFFGGDVVRYDAAGNLVQTINSPEFDRGVISDVELGPDNVIYVALSTDFFGGTVKGEVLKFDLGGTFLGSIVLPDDPVNIGYLYPFGFDVAADGSLWVPQLNSGDLVHVGPAGDLLNSYPLGLQPQDATVGANGQIYVSFIDFNFGGGKVLQVDPGSGNVSEFLPFAGFNPVDINATSDGGFWLAQHFEGAFKYDSSGNVTRSVPEVFPLDPQQDPSDNLWIASFFDGVAKYDAAGNFQFRQFTPGGDALGLAVTGVDSPDPLPPVDRVDYYSVDLRAGQTVTVAVDLLQGAPVTVELQDAAGNPIALGLASGPIDQVIDDFVVTTSGKYYIKISGDGSNYSLVVTRNADLDLEPNNDFDTAQDVLSTESPGGQWVLGFVGSGSSVDYSSGFTDTSGLTANGSALFVGDVARLTTGNFSEAGSIFTNDPVEITSFTNSFSFQILPGTIPLADGLTFTLQGGGPKELGPSGGGLGYGPDFPIPDRGIRNSVAVKFDVYNNAGEGINSTGLFTDGRSPTVPETGSGDVVVNLDGTGIDLNSEHPFQVAMAYDGTVLNVTITDTKTLASASQSYVVDIASQVGGNAAFVGFTGGTGGLSAVQDILDWKFDSSQTSSDFYRVKADEGKTIRIETTTPAGGAGEFINELDPSLTLYDASGKLVATNDNGAPDRRNASLSYKVPKNKGGIYYVEVGASTATPEPTQGEYLLNLKNTQAVLAPFEVESTLPPDGALLRSPPADITVSFNEQFNISTVQGADLKIDGLPGTGVAIVDGDTATFTAPAGAWATEGTHTVSIAAGAIKDLQATPLTAYSGTFTLDFTPPRVVSSSIQEGTVVPAGSLTYTVKFSEPLQTSLVDPFDFSLFGQLRGQSYSPASLSFDTTGTVLTVNYEGLLDDQYTLTLFSDPFSFVDLAGLFLDGEPVAWPIPPNKSGDGIEGGDFFVNFATDFDTRALPTPLQPVAPLGSLVYQTPDVPTSKGTIVFAGDTDAFTIDLDAGQTATIVIGAPGGSLQPTVSLVYDPTSEVLGSATAPAVGEDAVLQTIEVADPGTYRIVVGSADGLGLYSVDLILNAAVEDEAHGGPTNDSPADAQSLGAAFIDLNAGADRAAVLGQLEPFTLVGTIYLADFETGEQGFTVDNAPPDRSYLDGLWHLSTGRGQQPGHSASNSFYYGQFEGPDGGGTYSLGQVNPTTGSITSPPIALPTDTAVVANFNYVLQTRVFPTDVDFASLEVNDGSGWAELQRYDRVAESSEWTTAELVNLSRYAGQTIQLRWSFDTRRGPVGRAPEGWYVDDVLVSEAVLNDFYSFELQASDNATIALQSLSDANVDLTLIGPDRTTRLAKGTENLARNVDEIINNFIATTSGTYYLKVTGDPGAEYNLVVTRGVDFDTERNDDQAQAQDITGTSGALGAIVASGVDQGIGFEGIDFLGSNCGCLPPDTNAAVGGNWVVETVNTQIRVFDKTTGDVLLDESLSSFFGAPSAGDPYVVFDDIVDRWYVTAFDGGASGLFLAVSNGTDPLGGFLPTYHLTDVGGFPDYPKMGFNNDAVFISYNDFGSGGTAATIASIDKAAALSGTLTYYVSRPEFQFRAMPPAQMHGDTTGGVEWFVSTDGSEFGGDTMRVTKMTNYLSDSPIFAYTSLPVAPYQSAQQADQPGGGVTVFPNTTTTQVQYRNGQLVTAMASATAADGFVYPKGLYYRIDVSSGTPTLLQEGVIDPGAGVAVQMPSVDVDINGNLGLTWIESSSSEYLSMWVGTVDLTGNLASSVAAPGGGFFPANFRIGDYSTTVLDPSDNMTFWSANEYIGSDGFDNIWRTHIQSFTVEQPVDWYRVNTVAGNTLTISASIPASGAGEFVNTLNPTIELYDPLGNLVASTTGGSITAPADGGRYAVKVSSLDRSQGEYVLHVAGATGAQPAFAVTATDPSDGERVKGPTAQITVDFNDTVLLTSLTASDLTINGVAATAVTVVDGNTIRFDLPALLEGNQTVQIAAGAIHDVQDTSVGAFEMMFYEDITAPRVVFSSIQEGELVPAGDLSYIVKFSEPLRTGLVDVFDIGLTGQYRGTFQFPTSVAFNPEGTELTVNFTNLGDDAYTLTLFSNPDSFVDQVGWVLDGEPVTWNIPPNRSGNGVEGGDFFVNFLTDAGTQPLPTPLKAVDPPGSLVYQTPSNATGVIAFAGDTDEFTIDLDAGQKVTVLVNGLSHGLAVNFNVDDPGGSSIGTATASAPGGTAVLQTAAVLDAGTYTLQIGAADGLGLYSIRLIVNAAIEEEEHGGAPNNSLTDAQSLAAAFIELDDAGADRAAVLGTADAATILVNGSFETGDFSGWTTQTIGSPFVDWTVSQAGAGSGFFDPTSPQDGLYDAWNGFDGDGPMEYAMYQDVAIPAGSSPTLSWQERIQWDFVLTGTATQPRLYDVQIVDPDTNAVLETLYSFSTGTDLIIGDTGWQTHAADLTAYAGQTVRLLFHEFIPESFTGPGQIEFDTIKIEGVSTADDYYAFDLAAGQTATIVLADLVSSGVQVELLDGDGNVVASGLGGAPAPENMDDVIANYFATSTDTYYIRVFGNIRHDYNLVVTRDAAFDTEPNETQDTAQPLAGNNGALGAIVNVAVANIGTSFEGIDFLGSNCGCLPPDTNAAVGGNYVVETVNVQIRMFDKTTGNVLLDEPLFSFFGAPSAGDPYVVYDDIVDRWYVTAFNGSASGLLLAVSNDGNPLNGFLPTYELTDVGGFPDYPKMGFNNDAIFISYNDFGSGGTAATIASIDKAAALTGTLTYYVSRPQFQFRALPPAQMHGDATGGVEWFVSTDGSEFGGNTMRVTKMTNYLSDSPVFTYTSLPVAEYRSAQRADQPGGGLTVFPNTTTTQVQYRNGHLVTAMASGTAADGFVYPKGLYYQIDVSSGTPVLLQQGVIDPGPGVAVQMPSVDEDINGNLGLTWIESSSSEFLSMWVGAVDANGNFGASVAAPGGGFFPVNFRIGDYSTTVLDPSDGITFWSANEYIGSDGDSNIWRTYIASFQVDFEADSDWYDVDVADGSSLTLTATVPASDPGEFVNNLVPRIELYDEGGTLVDSAEGLGAVLTTGPLLAGTYSVRMSSVGDAGGEYVLVVENGAPAPIPLASHAASVPTLLPGDVNHDGVFDSADLVKVFQVGEYEDSLADNTGWQEGDWNGDRDFTTADLVLAFQSGYVSAEAPRNGGSISSFTSEAQRQEPYGAGSRLLEPQLVDRLFQDRGWLDDRKIGKGLL